MTGLIQSIRFHAGVDLDVLVAGPVLKVRCLAVVDDAVDCCDVVEVELHVVLGLVAEVQLIPASKGMG